MMASQTITLFTRQTELGPQPTSFAASVLFHVLTIALVLFGFAYKPPVTRVITEHYSVRELDLRMSEEQERAVRSLAAHPASHPGPRALASAGKTAPSPPLPPPMTQAKIGPQTLIQPDLPKPVVLPDQVPLPQVVIWSPSKTIVTKVVPPLPEKATAANVKPSVERPNDEMNLADVNVSSSFRPSVKSIVPPSTTSPIAVPIPQQVQLPPVTASQPSAQPTPAAIVSLSDLRMKNGTVALPPVSESAMSNSAAALTPDRMQGFALSAKNIPVGDSAEGSTQGSSGRANGAGSGSGQASSGKANNGGSGSGQGSDGKPNGAGLAAAGQPNSSNSVSGSQGPDQNGEPTSSQITLPKDGHFGAVVVGDSISDQYPEVTGVWGGRMAYTVYLHVGLSRNWIMQFSLPRNSDAANAGTVVSLDAPWPYSIVRPNLNTDSVDADAIMIHGFIDQAGRFETLRMVVPQAFQQAQFVLAALAKWQFRPAMQAGQSTRVEVLIIIPAQAD